MPNPNLVLNGVTIVDTRTGELARDMAIRTENGKIAQIGKAGSLGNHARTVDAKGAYVVPGFNDFHAHPLNSSDPEGSLNLLLAHGITGFRQMSGTPDAFHARRHGTLMPSDDAPELLQMAGEILTPMNAATPDVAVAEVRKQKEMGADFIKFIEGAPPTLFAVLEEAKKLGLRVIGHLPPSVDVRLATERGFASIEHLGPRDSILLGCSTEEAELRGAIVPGRAGPPISGGAISPDVIKRALANPSLFTSPAEFERYPRVIATFSEDRLADLANHFVKIGTWQVPTLIRLRTMGLAADPAYRNNPSLQYVPKPTREMWTDLAEQFNTKLPQPARDLLNALFDQQMKLPKPFKQSGAKMMAGSDLGGGWVVAGWGLHQEFDLLAEAGLTPLDVLQMTTLNGAEFLGRESSMGTVETGKNANLTLLAENPVAGVQNLHSVNGVVRDGKYYSSEALAALKQKTADRVAAGIEAPANVRQPCC